MEAAPAFAEESMRIQGLLGSDIAMQLDVCPPGDAPIERLRDAVACTTRWAERCLNTKRSGQALFGIVQGGTDVELRLSHAEELAALPLDGLALGGFSVGESRQAMHATLGAVASHLDRRDLLSDGSGTPSDLLLAIGAGVDLSTACFRRAMPKWQAFLRRTALDQTGRFREDREPLEPAAPPGLPRRLLPRTCAPLSADEILAHRLLTLHNLCPMVFDRGRRAAIVRREYDAWLRLGWPLWAQRGYGS